MTKFQNLSYETVIVNVVVKNGGVSKNSDYKGSELGLISEECIDIHILNF